MGERAVIAYIPEGQDVPTTYEEAVQAGVAGIYLHWDGEPECVAAFLTAAKHYKFRPCDYGLARLTQLIGNYLNAAEGTSVGVGPIQHLDTDNWDSGTYVVHNWEVVDRWFEMEEEAFVQERFNNVYDEVRAVNDAIFTDGDKKRT